jgi:hypothetical protein
LTYREFISFQKEDREIQEKWAEHKNSQSPKKTAEKYNDYTEEPAEYDTPKKILK